MVVCKGVVRECEGAVACMPLAWLFPVFSCDEASLGPHLASGCRLHLSFYYGTSITLTGLLLVS